MKKLNIKTKLAIGIFAISYYFTSNAYSDDKTIELLKKQQKEIEELKEKINQTSELTEALIEKSEESKETPLSNFMRNTELGGYGELHYNGGDKDEIDFHRFVVFIKHQFNEKFSFVSEIELEHALSGEGEEGEVELEQAYIEYKLNENHQLQAGVLLLPVSPLNLYHEPTRFFGVERNPVETSIIPTTFWEAGVAAKGNITESLDYNISFHSGLEVDTEGDDAFVIRDGRQKVSEATAKDGALTLALNWQAVPGVNFHLAAQYQNDITQSALDQNADALLLVAATDMRKGPFGFKALYSNWDISSDEAEALGKDRQRGWYVEPAYYLESSVGTFGVFGRYNNFDTSAGNSDNNSEQEQFDVGINYWPHPRIVLKADVAFVRAFGEEDDDDILNLGIGFEY